jgi:hypothetical protein
MNIAIYESFAVLRIDKMKGEQNALDCGVSVRLKVS